MLASHCQFFRLLEMASKKPITRAIFDQAREKFLIKALLKQVQAGKRADSGWKKEAWNDVLAQFNQKFSGDYTVAQLKNKHDNVKQIDVFRKMC